MQYGCSASKNGALTGVFLLYIWVLVDVFGCSMEMKFQSYRQEMEKSTD